MFQSKFILKTGFLYSSTKNLASLYAGSQILSLVNSNEYFQSAIVLGNSNFQLKFELLSIVTSTSLKKL